MIVKRLSAARAGNEARRDPTPEPLAAPYRPLSASPKGLANKPKPESPRVVAKNAVRTATPLPASLWAPVTAWAGSLGLHGLLVAVLLVGLLSEPPVLALAGGQGGDGTSAGGQGGGGAQGNPGEIAVDIVFQPAAADTAATYTTASARPLAPVIDSSLVTEVTPLVDAVPEIAAPPELKTPPIFETQALLETTPVLETQAIVEPLPELEALPMPEAPQLLDASPVREPARAVDIGSLAALPQSTVSSEPTELFGPTEPTQPVVSAEATQPLEAAEPVQPLEPTEPTQDAVLETPPPLPTAPSDVSAEPDLLAQETPPVSTRAETSEPSPVPDLSPPEPLPQTVAESVAETVPETVPLAESPASPPEPLELAMQPVPEAVDPVLEPPAVQTALLLPPDPTPEPQPPEVRPEQAPLAQPLSKPNRSVELAQPRRAAPRVSQRQDPAPQPRAPDPPQPTSRSSESPQPASPQQATTTSRTQSSGSAASSAAAANSGSGGTAGKADGNAGGSGLAGPTAGEMNSYAGRLRALLERHKRYPRSSQRRGEEGTVTLRFTLDSYGRVVSRRIVGSSGYDRLDDEVLDMLERASPLPRPPGNQSRLSLAIPIVFDLR